MVAAPFVGSFLGVVITRLPAGRPIVWGRSVCEACGAVLAPRDLVPVLSFAALRGRCRRCGAAIGAFPLAVELAATAVAASAVWAGPDGWRLLAGCVLGWALLTLAWIDARHLRLPDALTLPLLVAGLAEAGWLEPAALTDRALGAAIGYTALFLLAWAYRRWRGRDGLGEGDAKLLAAGGAWVGAAALGQVVLVAALTGLFYAAALRLRGRALTATTALPFGPCLAAGIWWMWLLAPQG